MRQILSRVRIVRRASPPGVQRTLITHNIRIPVGGWAATVRGVARGGHAALEGAPPCAAACLHFRWPPAEAGPADWHARRRLCQ